MCAILDCSPRISCQEYGIVLLYGKLPCIKNNNKEARKEAKYKVHQNSTSESRIYTVALKIIYSKIII